MPVWHYGAMEDIVRAAAERLDMPVLRMAPLVRVPIRTIRRWQAEGPPPHAGLLLELIAGGVVRREHLDGAPG